MTQREAIQAIDEKLLRMGKLDTIKGQPAYLADNSRKRKKPHESDRGENPTEHSNVKKPRESNSQSSPQNQNNPLQPWKVLNRQAHVNPLVPTTSIAAPPLTGVFRVTTMPSSSREAMSSFSTMAMRPAKKTKVSITSTLASAGDRICPLCGGPKHDLRDCLVPKGGVEK